MLSARELALRVLHETETEGAYSNIALRKALNASSLDQKDKAFVTELVQGAIKYKKRLDYEIQSLSTVRMKKISPWILCILRMGIYQLQFLDRIPASAAVNESVKLAGKYGHGAAKGFVNAILRKAPDPILPPENDPVLYLSVFYSYPEWMVERFLSVMGKEKAERMLAAGNEIPPVFVRRNGCAENEDTPNLFRSESAPWAWELTGPVDSDAFRRGEYTVQDAASQLVAFAIRPQRGMRILDLCAAPGGKTTHIAEKMEDVGEIIACDIYPHKLDLIRSAAERLGLSSICPTLSDATEYRESLGEFDAVLADVPCSGIGIIRRKPDIKWNRRPEDIRELSQTALMILTNAARYLKPGGVLVYSTCTVTEEENGKVTAAFLESHPSFRLDPFGDAFPIAEYRDRAEIQLLPDMYGTDGFYICRMKRIE